MIPWLYQCAGCRQPLDTDARGILCAHCADYATPAPRFCAECGSNRCVTLATCAYPWRKWPQATSVSSSLLSVGRGLILLKGWKYRPGHGWAPWLQQALHAPHLPHWEDASVVIPVGQSGNRSWFLQRNPAAELAEIIAKRLGKPVAYNALTRRQAGPAQKNLNRAHRLVATRAWQTQFAGPPPKTVLLVDDVRTTGHTLRSAGQALAQAGVERIHYFTLGFRPVAPLLPSQAHPPSQPWQGRLPIPPSRAGSNPLAEPKA